MKTAIVLAVLCAVAYATPSGGYHGGYHDYTSKDHKMVITDKVSLQRQYDIFRLFKYMHQPTYYEDFTKYMQEFNFEYMKQYVPDKYWTEFVRMWESGAYLPRGEIFSVYDETHVYQVKVLYDVFYYAKDFDSFFKFAIWARNYINEGMFLYTFSVAIIHRSDTHQYVLPPIYEIYPYYFVNSEIITKAHTLKQLYGGYYKQGQFQETGKNSYYYPQHYDTKYKHGVYQHGQYPYAEYINNEYVIYANYSGWYVKASPEQKLSYFTEDFGLNSYYYYYNLYFPYWMNSQEYQIHYEHRGEYVYYFYQQLLAYYYMHRLANNMGSIEYFDYDKYIKTPYYPTLYYPNGVFFPAREEYSYLYHYSGDYATYTDDITYFGTKEIQSYEERIKMAIDLGYIYDLSGTKINLYTPKGLHYLGNLIEGNADSVNKRFYGSLFMFFRTILGYSYYPTDKHHIVPSVLEHLETSMRDPVFYQFFKRILFYFQKYKYNMPKYTYDQLYYGGVNVEGVTFDKLYTYFENYDVDLTNAMYLSPEDFKYDQLPVKARYQRFTYKPFSYRINVNSKVTDKVVVRTFLGPKYDERGNKITMYNNYYDFVELDQFVYDVNMGKNEIVRDSTDFYYYRAPRTSYKTLYYRVMRALKGDGEFMYDLGDKYYWRPNNFVLPMGKASGMEYQVYVYVSKYEAPSTETTKTQPGHYVYHPYYVYDSKPYGYPLDRPMSYYYHMIPNSYMTNVYIYFKNYKEDYNRVSTY